MNKLTISCEFFPTNTNQGAEKLKIVRDQLADFKPEYFSVTYGAGGSTQERTWDLVKQIHLENRIPVMPHLTCVSTDKNLIIKLLDDYYQLGIRKIMTLRGDMPSGTYYAGEVESVVDLIYLIRDRFGDDIDISVAAYPEIHPRAQNPNQDLNHFCKKMQAGANQAVTQYFFNVDAYLYFRDEVIKKGINQPIIAGIMPITNFHQLARFSDSCGADLPFWIRKRLQAFGDDLPSLQQFGHEVVVKICQSLIREGVEKLHFYSMNKAESVINIINDLGFAN